MNARQIKRLENKKKKTDALLNMKSLNDIERQLKKPLIDPKTGAARKKSKLMLYLKHQGENAQILDTGLPQSRIPLFVSDVRDFLLYIVFNKSCPPYTEPRWCNISKKIINHTILLIIEGVGCNDYLRSTHELPTLRDDFVKLEIVPPVSYATNVVHELVMSSRQREQGIPQSSTASCYITTSNSVQSAFPIKPITQLKNSSSFASKSNQQTEPQTCKDMFKSSSCLIEDDFERLQSLDTSSRNLSIEKSNVNTALSPPKSNSSSLKSKLTNSESLVSTRTEEDKAESNKTEDSLSNKGLDSTINESNLPFSSSNNNQVSNRIEVSRKIGTDIKSCGEILKDETSSNLANKTAGKRSNQTFINDGTPNSKIQDGLETFDQSNKQTERKNNDERSSEEFDVVNSDLKNTKTLNEARSENQGPILDNFPRTLLLLSAVQMVEEDYPIPLRGELSARFKDYKNTKDVYAEVTPLSPLYALDCEMCQTGNDRTELTRITIVDEDENVVFESLVKPYNRITNYLTAFSGITQALLNPVTTRLEHVQATIQRLLPADAILVGQSLNCDLHALKMMHPYVIDTSVIFNTTGARTHKPKLKLLASHFLKTEIQNGERGHCSQEDALAALRLVKLKLSKDPQFGDTVALQKAIRHINSKLSCNQDIQNLFAYFDKIVTKKKAMPFERTALVLTTDRITESQYKKYLQTYRTQCKLISQDNDMRETKANGNEDTSNEVIEMSSEKSSRDKADELMEIDCENTLDAKTKEKIGELVEVIGETESSNINDEADSSSGASQKSIEKNSSTENTKSKNQKISQTIKDKLNNGKDIAIIDGNVESISKSVKRKSSRNCTSPQNDNPSKNSCTFTSSFKNSSYTEEIDTKAFNTTTSSIERTSPPMKQRRKFVLSESDLNHAQEKSHKDSHTMKDKQINGKDVEIVLDNVETNKIKLQEELNKNSVEMIENKHSVQKDLPTEITPTLSLAHSHLISRVLLESKQRSLLIAHTQCHKRELEEMVSTLDNGLAENQLLVVLCVPRGEMSSGVCFVSAGSC